jgi:putative aminopeptidase FrvX
LENEIKGLLKRLTEAPGVAGYEMDVGKMIYHELKRYADSIETDNFGNVISLKKASVKDGPKIMLAGHMDEIGLLVKHIDEKGFLDFERIGGVSPRSLFSQPVIIHCKKGPVTGLTCCKPPETPEEANKMPDLKTFFIDIGVKSRSEAEKLGVRIGDPVTFERPFKALGKGNILASKAFDDRVGVCVIVETMRNLAKKKLEANVYGVADVQEEVGGRGAQVAAYKIAPDMAIAVDITFAGDIPGIAEKDQVTKVGAGPAIKVMDNAGGALGLISHPKVRELLVSTAEEEKIPYQMEILPRGSTDAATIHLTREGVPSGAISIPTRYAHSYELLDVNDVVNAVRLLTATIGKVQKGFSFKTHETHRL